MQITYQCLWPSILENFIMCWNTWTMISINNTLIFFNDVIGSVQNKSNSIYRWILPSNFSMIMVLVYIILFILLYIFLSLAQVHLIGFTMSVYCKFHLIYVLLFFTVHYDCICLYCTCIMTSSISDRLHTLYGLTECKINEMKLNRNECPSHSFPQILTVKHWQSVNLLVDFLLNISCVVGFILK
jgi:hypothetical protein